MKIANFSENSLLSFKLLKAFYYLSNPLLPPFTLVQLDRDKKTLTICSSRFIFSRDLLHPEKILEKVAQLHDDCDQKGDEKENAT